jgi:hypothetical protein
LPNLDPTQVSLASSPHRPSSERSRSSVGVGVLVRVVVVEGLLDVLVGGDDWGEEDGGAGVFEVGVTGFSNVIVDVGGQGNAIRTVVAISIHNPKFMLTYGPVGLYKLTVRVGVGNGIKELSVVKIGARGLLTPTVMAIGIATVGVPMLALTSTGRATEERLALGKTAKDEV